MNKHPFKKSTINEDNAIASRRKFLKQMACGSLLAMSGTGAATAARHVIYPAGHGHHHPHEQPDRSLVRRLYSDIFSSRASTSHLHTPAYKTLSFEHAHTGDKLKLTYFEQGQLY